MRVFWIGRHCILTAAAIQFASGCQWVMGGIPHREEDQSHVIQERDGSTQSPHEDAGETSDASQTSDADMNTERDGGTAKDGAVDASGEPRATPDAAQQSEPDATQQSEPDAAQEPDAMIDVSCESPKRWYPDNDRDGYGVDEGMVESCVRPGERWAQESEDCYDKNEDVHPGQEMFFGDYYVRENGLHSYDYNCDGVEEDSDQQVGLESCRSLLGIGCNGQGYVQTGRTSVDGTVNSYCGSTTLYKCSAGALSCSTEFLEDRPPFLCR